MVESTILSSPVLMLLLAAALGLCLFVKLCKVTQGWFSRLSVVLVVATLSYALILGAGTGEVLTMLLLFLCLNLEGWK